MSDSNSTPPLPSDTPAKPRSDFPLFPHASGQWAKKIRGKMHYFGVGADPDAALDNYDKQKDALLAGRKPRLDPSCVTIKDVANDFLNAKDALMEAGELSVRTRTDYQQAAYAWRKR